MEPAPALDATDGISRSVVETAHNPCLPFQGALRSLVDGGGAVKVHNLQPAIGGCNDKQFGFDIHGVDAFLALDSGCRTLLPQVPILDSLVPRASHDHLSIVDLEGTDTLDWLIMSGDLLCSAGVYVQKAGRFIYARANDVVAILSVAVV